MQNLKGFKGIHSSELRGFFTGLILGGGMIDKGVRNRAFVIKSLNRDFIDMIAGIIDNNTPFKYTIHTHDERIDNNNVHYRLNWLLRITAHPYFAKLYHYFYDDYRHRIISCKALNWLNPIGLACWYMSDGYVCLVGKTKGIIRQRRMEICTDRYNDIKPAVDRLYELGIKATIIKRGKCHRIRIKKESYETFINLIKDYIVPSMQYKLYLGYTEQPKWMFNESWEYQQYLSSAITQTDNAVG